MFTRLGGHVFTLLFAWDDNYIGRETDFSLFLLIGVMMTRAVDVLIDIIIKRHYPMSHDQALNYGAEQL